MPASGRLPLDQLNSHADQSGTMGRVSDRFGRRASTCSSVVARCAGLSTCRRRRVARAYDTSHLTVHRYQTQPSERGRQLLLTAQLRSWFGFVTVASGCWDMHGDGNKPGVLRAVNRCQAAGSRRSAFLEDVHERG